MPLVIVCGHPASGKSRHAAALAAHLRAQGKAVETVSEATLHLDKNEAYCDGDAEKNTRGALRSAVHRKISKDVTVIVDSLNFIKGFRYELYCLARACATHHCVLFCTAGPELVRVWNKQRDDCYTDAIMADLLGRMEAPRRHQRWDSPLFEVAPDAETPCEDVARALFEGKAPKPSFATQAQPLSQPNLLHQIDSRTRAVIAQIAEQQSGPLEYGTMRVEGAQQPLELPAQVSTARLRRLRTQFMSMLKTQTPADVNAAMAMFVEFLNRSFAED